MHPHCHTYTRGTLYSTNLYLRSFSRAKKTSTLGPRSVALLEAGTKSGLKRVLNGVHVHLGDDQVHSPEACLPVFLRRRPDRDLFVGVHHGEALDRLFALRNLGDLSDLSTYNYCVLPLWGRGPRAVQLNKQTHSHVPSHNLPHHQCLPLARSLQGDESDKVDHFTVL